MDGNFRDAKVRWKMTESKPWNWEEVKESIWLEPSEESYYYCEKWKQTGKKNVLDLGSGLGRHAILFAKHGFNVSAVDLSPYAVESMKKWQAEEKLEIHSAVADMKSLPFDTDSFDCLWSYHVVSHTDTPGFLEVLNEIKRVLKPGGELFLTLCSKETWSYKEAGFPVIDENTVLKTEGVEVEIPHFFVNMDDILNLFEDFELNRVRHVDDCYFDGAVRNSKHYYITANLK